MFFLPYTAQGLSSSREACLFINLNRIFLRGPQARPLMLSQVDVLPGCWRVESAETNSGNRRWRVAARIEYKRVRREGGEMFLHPRSTLVFPKSSNRSLIGLQADFPTQAAKLSGEKCRVGSTGPQARIDALSHPSILARRLPKIVVAPELGMEGDRGEAARVDNESTRIRYRMMDILEQEKRVPGHAVNPANESVRHPLGRIG